MPCLKLITLLKFKIKELTNKEIGEGKYNTSQEVTISMFFKMKS